jgi:aspartate-semialdehyde dehydrogenase
MRKYNIAVVGATGAVGEELFRVLEEQDFPIGQLLPLASAKSAGSKIEFKDQEYTVYELTCDIWDNHEIDIAFFSAGGSISAKYAKCAVDSGAVVIDNTSYFRMDETIPLVVPEVNPQDIQMYKESGIIANPNCSTIQMVQPLKAIDNIYDIKRVDVSTYQATSGAGKKGMEELVKQMQDFFAFNLDNSTIEAFPHQIALNVIPQIDKPMPSGFTKEEEKMVYESQKILHKDIKISATCVRVPVLRSHSESVSVTFDEDIDVDLDKIKNALSEFENIELLDDLESGVYPMPIISTDTDITYVGRVRKDIYQDNIVHFWVVADQVRVGAATNAVRIAQKFIKLED